MSMPMIGTWAACTPQQRNQEISLNVILTQERVLVGSSDNLELLGVLVVTEPAPARALDRSRLGIHLLLEVLEATKVSLHVVMEDTGVGNLDLSRAGGSKVLPEELQIMLDGVHPSVLQR